jgi:hypothetical protein
MDDTAVVTVARDIGERLMVVFRVRAGIPYAYVALGNEMRR